MQKRIQSKEELEKFYSTDDPWDYDNTPDDKKRLEQILYILPKKQYERTLDFGCGNGFVTTHLPGAEVIGIDLSQNAIESAKARAIRDNGTHISFECKNIFDCSPAHFGTFDLIVITGILYPQYICDGFAAIRMIIDSLLRTGGILVCCHISAWGNMRFPYLTVDTMFYNYREYMHRLEVYQK